MSLNLLRNQRIERLSFNEIDASRANQKVQKQWHDDSTDHRSFGDVLMLAQKEKIIKDEHNYVASNRGDNIMIDEPNLREIHKRYLRG
jgi:hypothetical protein